VCDTPLFTLNSDFSLLHFLLAHVSRDGRDLAIMTTRNHVFLIRDFERVCRGETSLETSGLDLHLSDRAECFNLAFEHGRICVFTVRSISYSGPYSAYSCAFFLIFDFFSPLGST
jgi:hypothetical protein